MQVTASEVWIILSART